MRVVKKEAELGGTKLRHKQRDAVPGNKSLLKANEAWAGIMDEDVSKGEPVTAMQA